MREIEIPSMVFFLYLGLTVSLDDCTLAAVFALVFRLMSAQTAYLWVYFGVA